MHIVLNWARVKSTDLHGWSKARESLCVRQLLKAQ